jgi:hypothetical protein
MAAQEIIVKRYVVRLSGGERSGVLVVPSDTPNGRFDMGRKQRRYTSWRATTCNWRACHQPMARTPLL